MSERTCLVDGCAKPVRVRGWCSAHYSRLSRRGDVRGTLTSCEVCGVESWGRPDKRCCGARRCKRALWRQAEQKRQQQRPVCSIDGCEKTSEAKGLCPAHYAKLKRYGDPLGQQRRCDVCGAGFYVYARGSELTCGRRECRRVIRHRAVDRRRAWELGAFVEDIDHERVFERDGWRCHLCGKAVRRDVKRPHPQSPSLDHVIPLSRDGTHEYSNVRCAHLRCNIAKGNRAVNEQLILV